MYGGGIKNIKGFRVGHAEEARARTGCTAVLCPKDTVGGVSVRGAAPGTRETDLLDPQNTVQCVHAVMLCGGSAYGLDAASGAMAYLEEQGIGLEVGTAVVPIVPAAVLFDLAVGDARVRPDKSMGYRACADAKADDNTMGRHGAGCGATVGKLLGMERCSVSGIGQASIKLPCGASVAAIVAVNAVGNIVNYKNNEILAGVKGKDGFVDALELLTGETIADCTPGGNTTIGIIVTDAKLTKAQANRLASCAHDGIAWAVRPAHLSMDGDTLFALSAGDMNADFASLCAAGMEAVARAICNAAEASRD